MAANMKMHEKYLEVLKTFDDFVTLKEWAIKFNEIYLPNSKDKYDVKIRKIEKSISSLVSTGKWSDMLVIDKNLKPKKIKFIEDKQDKLNNIQKNIYLSKSPREVKTINFKRMMDAIDGLIDDPDLPNRDDSEYIGNESIKGIEQIEIHEFNKCLLFEMAKRNNDASEIIDKLNYINKLKEEYPYLEYNEPFLPLLTVEVKEKYLDICKFSLAEFKNELEFSVDITYSNNYNENWQNNIFNDKGNDSFDIDKKTMKQYMFKDTTKKTTLKYGDLQGGILKKMSLHLEKQLKNEFFIYSDGYCKEMNRDCNNQIAMKELILHNTSDSKKSILKRSTALKNLRAFKPTDTINIADMFFIYDYYKKRKKNGYTIYIEQDLKLELTKHHKITIKDDNIENNLTYGMCLERYEELKDFDADFYIVEKSILIKLKIMQFFIDDKGYEYII